jgi:hypothetical protein
LKSRRPKRAPKKRRNTIFPARPDIAVPQTGEQLSGFREGIVGSVYVLSAVFDLPVFIFLRLAHDHSCTIASLANYLVFVPLVKKL